MDLDDHAYYNDYGREEAESLLTRFNEGVLARDEVRGEVVDAWNGAARPGMLLAKADWKRLWDYAGYTYAYLDSGEKRIEAAAPPTSSIRLYRASPEEFRFNFSWTSEEEQARKWLGIPEVWAAEFTPERLLARIEVKTNGEQEYIAIPDGLHLERIR